MHGAQRRQGGSIVRACICVTMDTRGECELITGASHGNYCVFVSRLKHNQSQRIVEVMMMVTGQSEFPNHFLVAIDYNLFFYRHVFFSQRPRFFLSSQFGKLLYFKGIYMSFIAATVSISYIIMP